MKLVVLLVLFCMSLSAVCNAEDSTDISKKTQRQAKHPVENKNFLFGLEARNYTYSEPGFVSHAGYLFGLWGEWGWGGVLGNGKTSGLLQFGSLAYDGEACNLSGTSCVPLSATTNDVLAKLSVRLEYSFNPRFSIFYGAGFRYLYDKGEGSSFYSRVGQWIFLPVGFSFRSDTSPSNLFVELEYDHTLSGVLKSGLSEVSATLNDITSNQKGGYGLVLSGGMNINENLMTSLIYEGWYANDSDVMASGGQNFREPANNSQAFGVRLGYLF